MSKTALVTGANGGIGCALTLELVKRGYFVYATDIEFSEQNTILFGAEQKISTLTMDVTNNKSVREVRDQVVTEKEHLDLLYCNAGRVLVGMTVDLEDDEIQSLFELNLFAQMRLVREFIKCIIPVKGTIAFSGSVTKDLPLHSNSLYTSSKAALDQYASVLQCEMRNYGVKVIDVVGGYMRTPIFDSHVYSVKEGSVFEFERYQHEYSKRGKVLAKTMNDAMDPSVFAKRALDKIAKADLNTLRVYEGKKSGTISLLTKWAPQGKLIDFVLNMFNLNFDYTKDRELQK